MSAEIRWQLARPTRFPGLVSGPGEDVDRNPARVLSAIALASVAAGAINIAAAATVGRGSAQNLAFFVVLGAAQLVWGAVAMVRAPGGGWRSVPRAIWWRWSPGWCSRRHLPHVGRPDSRESHPGEPAKVRGSQRAGHDDRLLRRPWPVESGLTEPYIGSVRGPSQGRAQRRHDPAGELRSERVAAPSPGGGATRGQGPAPRGSLNDTQAATGRCRGDRAHHPAEAIIA